MPIPQYLHEWGISTQRPLYSICRAVRMRYWGLSVYRHRVKANENVTEGVSVGAAPSNENGTGRGDHSFRGAKRQGWERRQPARPGWLPPARLRGACLPTVRRVGRRCAGAGQRVGLGIQRLEALALGGGACASGEKA